MAISFKNVGIHGFKGIFPLASLSGKSNKTGHFSTLKKPKNTLIHCIFQLFALISPACFFERSLFVF